MAAVTSGSDWQLAGVKGSGPCVYVITPQASLEGQQCSQRKNGSTSILWGRRLSTWHIITCTTFLLPMATPQEVDSFHNLYVQESTKAVAPWRGEASELILQQAALRG